MILKNKPIRAQLVTAFMLTSAVALCLAFVGYFAYEIYSFRKTTLYQLSVISKLISSNSTAALAFANAEDANEVLSALEAEPHIQAGILYNDKGEVFARYPLKESGIAIPKKPGAHEFEFDARSVSGFHPIVYEGRSLGTLYLQADISAMYDRFQLYITITIAVIFASLLVSYFFSNRLQKNLSKPILDLAETAKQISDNADYSVRAKKYYDDEVGLLTAAFNKMLVRIENQNHEITQLNQGLENKVQERTKELETAYREMESFSYSVSHDLNAPLRHIDSFVSIYLARYGDNLDEPAKKTLASVTKNARKMRDLIDDLLAFAQLGNKDLQKADVNMTALVQQIFDELRRDEEDREIIFNLSKLPMAHADQGTMRQVWTNLISNAIKYTRHKIPAEINVGFQIVRDEVVYCVKDNGAGFDMAHYDKLFNAFQRLHTQNEFEGTGVGLAIVQRIVSKHGGRVWAESGIEKGSTFFFSLPLPSSESTKAPINLISENYQAVKELL